MKNVIRKKWEMTAATPVYIKYMFSPTKSIHNRKNISVEIYAIATARLKSKMLRQISNSLQWRYNGHDGISNHQPHDCLLDCLFRRRSKKAPKLRVAGLCAGNSPVTGEFPAQRVSNAENVSIWWRHHVFVLSVFIWRNGQFLAHWFPLAIVDINVSST